MQVLAVSQVSPDMLHASLECIMLELLALSYQLRACGVVPSVVSGA